MKKFILISLLSILSFSAFAQYVDPSHQTREDNKTDYRVPTTTNSSVINVTDTQLQVLQQSLQSNLKDARTTFILSSVAMVASYVVCSVTADDAVFATSTTALTVSSIIADISFIKWISISQDKQALDLYLNKISLKF